MPCPPRRRNATGEAAPQPARTYVDSPGRVDDQELSHTGCDARRPTLIPSDLAKWSIDASTTVFCFHRFIAAMRLSVRAELRETRTRMSVADSRTSFCVAGSSMDHMVPHEPTESR